ncbi:MAG: hypothetical protein R6X25_01235 [Candidatus Krumholzibacteriia bacterium]
MRRCLVPVILIVGSAPAAAQLSCLETDRLRLVYLDPHQSWLVPHVARCFENSLRRQSQLFTYDPAEKINVILNDFADYGNGGAGTVPRNGLLLYIAPMNYAYETYPANERINTLMNHELVHIVNYDRFTGGDRFWRRLFAGKVGETPEHPETIIFGYLTSPRAAAPRWYHEGVAVFVETWMAGGIGRAQGSYDEMVFRAKVGDGSRFYDPLGLVAEGTKVDFQLELNSYLYGTRFVSWLVYEYGPDAVLRWYTRSEGSKAHYAAQFAAVFGTSLGEAWAGWISFEHEWQQRNLAAIRRFPVTPHRDLSDRALGSISRAWYDPERQRIYAGLNYPGVVAHVGAIDLRTGAVERLTDVKGPLMYSVTSLAWDPRRARLFYTADNSAWRDLIELDPETGATRCLMKDLRVGELVVDPVDGALWGVRHFNGLCTLVRLPVPHDDWQQVHTFDYGRTVYNLDISPDGSLLAASIGEVTGRHAVHVLRTDSLAVGSPVAVASFDFGSTIPSNFVFDETGRRLYGTSYFTGVSNVFRYDLDTGELQCLSNTETGFFQPVPVGADSLIVFRYTGDGFLPAMLGIHPIDDVEPIAFLGARIWERHPEVRDWKVPSPAIVPLDSLVTYRGPYRALSRVEVESVVPVVEGYKDAVAYGAHLRLSDPLALHSLAATASWSPDGRLEGDERLHAELSYRRHDWRLDAGWNDADFYDLFGPTKTSRKGYRLAAGYTRTLLYDLPRQLDLSLDLSWWGGLERLPAYQNVLASYSELLTGRVHLGYRNLRFSLGAVDYEKGHSWSLALSDNHVAGRSLPQAVATLDAGRPLGWHHSSLWLRLAGGVAPAEHDDPFANFYFGGFGNNWVDRGEIRRYRLWYAFPGLDLNEVGGTSFGRVLLDWNLPPLRFRRLGKPSFHATWARTSLFAGALVTTPGNPEHRRSLATLGVQTDLRLVLLSHLEMTASAGYAVAIERHRGPGEEFMVSLQILR